MRDKEYRNLPNLIIGFHGCDSDTYEKVLHKHESLRASHNAYDWLGNGIYFWENSLARAEDWATCDMMSPKILGTDLARLLSAVNEWDSGQYETVLPFLEQKRLPEWTHITKPYKKQWKAAASRRNRKTI